MNQSTLGPIESIAYFNLYTTETKRNKIQTIYSSELSFKKLC